MDSYAYKKRIVAFGLALGRMEQLNVRILEGQSQIRFFERFPDPYSQPIRNVVSPFLGRNVFHQFPTLNKSDGYTLA